VAKRNRGRPLREGASPATAERTTRPRRRTVQRSERGALDRYRTPLIAGVAVIGLLIIGFVFFQGATQAAYECRTLLTPGPVETPRTPRPATPSPSPALSPTSSPATSPQASPGGSPDASPAGSPTAEPSPAPSPSPAPDPTARLGFPTGELGRQHAPTGQPLTYAYCPPASGSHYNEPGVAPMPRVPARPGTLAGKLGT
jgi:hypothetical protein